MFAIDVMIVRWVTDDQPGIVECELTDRFGKAWRFVEKLPVVSTRLLGSEAKYPQPGILACEVAKRGHDGLGREIAEIDTGRPWGIEAVDGCTRFHVFADQLTEITGR